jgi:hypothetical protein
MITRLAKARFQLPACEDDLWHEVVVQLLGQRHADEEQARDHLRLLEELAFHHVFCGRPLTYAFAKKTATWLAKAEELEGAGNQARKWLTDLEGWELLVRRGSGNEAVYEFAIPTLDEYFAARHLAARWNDKHYRDWLPGGDRWEERGVPLPCPSPHCGASLPPFRDLFRRVEYEETLLLMVGLLKDSAREEALLKGLYSDVDLALKALSRCRHPHAGTIQEVSDLLLMTTPNPYSCRGGLGAIKEARLAVIRDAIVVHFLPACCEPDPVIRSIAVFALGQTGEERALRPLLAALHDTDDVVRENAVHALSTIGDQRSVVPLITLLDDRNEWVRAGSAWALVEIGRSTVEPLLAALGDPNARVREGAAYALGRIGDVRAVEPLIAALDDRENWVRARAAWALGYLEDSRAVERLIAELANPDGEVRECAAYALGHIGNERAIPVLGVLLCDRREAVRDASRWALDRVRKR